MQSWKLQHNLRFFAILTTACTTILTSPGARASFSLLILPVLCFHASPKLCFVSSIFLSISPHHRYNKTLARTQHSSTFPPLLLPIAFFQTVFFNFSIFMTSPVFSCKFNTAPHPNFVAVCKPMNECLQLQLALNWTSWLVSSMLRTYSACLEPLSLQTSALIFREKHGRCECMQKWDWQLRII